MAEKLNLSSPWVIFYRMIQALFGRDPQIKVVFDEDNLVLKLYVANPEKAEAISQLLPTEKVFGNVTLRITVIPANALGVSKIDTFRKAFEGNPAVSEIITLSNISSNDFSYVVFEKEVVQFHDDSLSDPHGTCSTLNQEIAKEVFGQQDGIFFTTATE